MVEQVKLAIVIPAYKAAFFERTLESIALQTDQRFRVYIGDDASDDALIPGLEAAGAFPYPLARAAAAQPEVLARWRETLAAVGK